MLSLSLIVTEGASCWYASLAWMPFGLISQTRTLLSQEPGGARCLAPDHAATRAQRAI